MGFGMTSPFSALRISHRVLLLALVALAGIATVSGTLLFQRQIEAGYRQASERLAAREATVVALTNDLQASHLHEKDFLLAKDMSAIERFETSVAAGSKAIGDLGATASPELQTQLGLLSTGLVSYTEAVAALVKKNQELGLDPDSGLEGSMRIAVHSIEALVENVANAEIRASMLMLRRHEKDFILRRDAGYVEKHAQETDTFKAMARKEFPPGVKRQRVMDALEMYGTSFRLYSEGAMAEKQARVDVTAAYDALQPVIAKVLTFYADEKAANVKENKAVASRNLAIVAGVIGATIITLFLGVYLIGRSITRPVLTITKAMRRLAGGETEFAVPGAGRRDEFGSMADALEVFRHAAIANRELEAEAAAARKRSESERLRVQAEAEAEAQARLLEATSGLAAGLRGLASGDLSFDLREPFAPDFEALRHDLNQALRQLDGVMGEIVQSSLSIDSGSREIGQSAHDLARRTEQQAASLEETAAALDEITTNVKLSAKRAQEAREMASEANGDAARTGTLVSETIEAMARIEQSSGKIASIIGVIDEIAFQTNLLALNAGVEAARAGEAGRGFAVVAQEVRELAQRSATAAGEIKSLIRNSVEEVGEGARFVRETGSALSRIGGSVQAISAHIDAIAVAAQEQSTGLGEINASVNQLDQGTQQNAAMVEENNAASAVLSSEASRLKELVSMFRLSDAIGEGTYTPAIQAHRAA